MLSLLLVGSILLVDISVPACSGELGHELMHSALVLLVLWIFASSDLLSKPSAGLEQNQIRSSTNTGPVVHSVRVPAAPLVKAEPDGLLGKEVRVSTESPQARAAEATVQLGACKLWRDLGCLLIQGFGFVEVPLLLVGEELEEDQAHEEAGCDEVRGCHAVTCDLSAEKEDVGWSGYSEQENLICSC